MFFTSSNLDDQVVSTVVVSEASIPDQAEPALVGAVGVLAVGVDVVVGRSVDWQRRRRRFDVVPRRRRRCWRRRCCLSRRVGNADVVAVVVVVAVDVAGSVLVQALHQDLQNVLLGDRWLDGQASGVLQRLLVLDLRRLELVLQKLDLWHAHRHPALLRVNFWLDGGPGTRRSLWASTLAGSLI